MVATSRAADLRNRILAVQAGSATSVRLRDREPNSYNRISTTAGVPTVTARAWSGMGWEDLRVLGTVELRP